MRSRLATCVYIAVGLSVATSSQAPPPAFELDEVSIAQLQQWMQTGRFTSRRLVDLYLERIERVDRSGPALRSVIEINPEAQAIADRLDAERKATGSRGPLHGIPVSSKTTSTPPIG